MKVIKSNKKNKRFTAVFKDGTEIHFGQSNPKHGTYLDHKDKTKRMNYRKRHSVNEKQFYNNPKKPATLSRFILWGDETNLSDAVDKYNKKFNL